MRALNRFKESEIKDLLDKFAKKDPTVNPLVPGEAQDKIFEKLDKSYRASGDCICEICHKKYYDHPEYIYSGITNNGIPWLNELCNGDLVHL